MIKAKVVDNKPPYAAYNKYSIYHCLRGSFTPYFYEKQNRHVVVDHKIVPHCSSFVLFILQLINRVFDRLLATNSFSYWLLFTTKLYFNIFFIMNQNLLATNTVQTSLTGNNSNDGKENKAYSIVQLLKNNIMDDSSLSESELDKYTKTKKSLFATLIKRKHTIKRPKVKITEKIETCSTINIETGSASSEQELAGYQMSSKNEKYFSPIKEEGSVLRKKQHCSFFKKIMKKSKVEKSMLKNSGDYDGHNKGCDAHKCDYKILTHLNNFIPTSYLPKYNIKLINSMNELQNILENLQYSEEHFTHLLKKYVEDSNFQQQLMQACFEYVSLQNSAKNQTNVLADGLWLQHQEMSKIHEHNLQKKLNLLVDANRTLQFQNENMCRHCEKLAARTNLYPKRFLHMRSFGKIYARHLIENNRKLQNKLKTVTNVIADFEDEMQKLQQQKNELEEQRRKLKSQVYHLEGVIDRDRSDHELEKIALHKKLSSQNRLIKDGEQACKYFLQELITFERQTKELDIVIKRPNFSCSTICLPAIILQIRSYTNELLVGILSAYNDVISLAKDVSKLRYTNARLQENLQKSTNELDNLCKRLERNKESDSNELETRYNELKQDTFTLNLKLGTTEEQNKILQEEINNTKKALNEANAKVNDYMEQNLKMSTQITTIAQIMSQLEPNNLGKNFSSSQDELECLRLRCVQVATDRKCLSERCANLEEENLTFLQNQELYQQDLNTLQEAINMLHAENELMKNQLATEHQTVISLQSERVKYLEEKNILKTIFLHLKSEISRVQQLEGAVNDMTKETNRLSLIAEFNKQLGEQLKHEMNAKDNTILELKHSLEQLSHLHIDNDKEKVSLSVQLSEASTTKDKLRNCLEMELKKNLHLDESKRKLETSTQSQLQIYEEMQRNERAALRELLRNFKGITKQRDALVYLCEENKQKQYELEKYCDEWKKKYDQVVSQISEKDNEIKKLAQKIEEKDAKLKEIEQQNQIHEAKHEKTLRKMDKLLGQLRSEKEELENSNNYLKNNIHKLQDDLNDAREKEKEAKDQLMAKTTECVSIGNELSAHKNELHLVNQENIRIKTEIEFINKMYETKIDELNNFMSQVSSKDNLYLESHNTMLNKEQEISQLNRIIMDLKHKITQLEQERSSIKRENEEQMNIMIGYENQLAMLADIETSKLKLEKELYNIQLEHKSTLCDLENSKKEIARLDTELQQQIIKCENDKELFQKQTKELLLKYNQQKITIEEEIDSIASQLTNVTENLHNEKSCYDELSQAHEGLKSNFAELKNKLSEEVRAHQQTCRKLEETDNIMKNLATEKNDLQKQIRSLLLESEEYKESKNQLTGEVNSLQTILTQGRRQYEFILSKNNSLEEEIKKLRQETQSLPSCRGEIKKMQSQLEEKASELKAAKETIEQLRKELAESQKALFDLKEDYFSLQQKVTGLEFKNCELTLQIHESQAKLKTERSLFKELKQFKGEDSDEATAIATSECGDSFYKSEENFMEF